MPYVLLVIGAVIGLFGLYKFFLSANPKQISAFVMSAVFMLLTVVLVFMAVTGRLPAAIALVVAMWPLALAFWKAKQPRKPAAGPKPGPMTRAEAFEILALAETATPEDIEEAYKRLMMKVHPDLQGSDWMAAKLNEARDLLLK